MPVWALFLSLAPSTATLPTIYPTSTSTSTLRQAMAHGKWWAITSLLFAASYATAQVPTPIRSVSALPATCKGGNPAVSSDMVVLIVAGVGTNYLCTAPNVWTQVTGGSGSPPGGTTGTTQFNSGVGVFGGTLGEV